MEEMSGKSKYRIESPRSSYFQQGKKLCWSEAFHSIPQGVGMLCVLGHTTPLQLVVLWLQGRGVSKRG